jgi:hypothetical protein
MVRSQIDKRPLISPVGDSSPSLLKPFDDAKSGAELDWDIYRSIR